MAKKLMQNQSKLLSSGTNIQNSDLYCIQVQQSLFIAYKYSKVCSLSGATVIFIEKYIVKIANFFLAFRCLTGEH